MRHIAAPRHEAPDDAGKVAHIYPKKILPIGDCFDIEHHQTTTPSPPSPLLRSHKLNTFNLEISGGGGGGAKSLQGASARGGRIWKKHRTQVSNHRPFGTAAAAVAAAHATVSRLRDTYLMLGDFDVLLPDCPCTFFQHTTKTSSKRATAFEVRSSSAVVHRGSHLYAVVRVITIRRMILSR